MFEIDFFELCFLAETCIPPVPIARGMFFQHLTEKYHKQMSNEQRKHLFTWLQKSDRYDITNEDVNIFHCRFDPDNQYMVTTNYNNINNLVETFLMDGRYHVSSNSWVSEEFINSVEKKCYT